MTDREPLGPDGPMRPGALLAGRYRLIERLGGGAMGEVFRADDLRLKRRVAVKRLLPHLVAREDLIARAEREGHILASLDHPGIIRVYDMFRSQGGGLFLILQLVEGRSLEEELRERGRLPWARCADVGIEVCAALEEAHRAGVIHRDIKPANILLAALGGVRVADFGIARLSDAATGTAEGSPLGTPAYAAPEQATRGEATASSDLYSLCCVLYEAACGRPPFPMDHDASPWTVVYRHANDPPPDPRTFARHVPDEAAEILLRGLEKEPSRRFASAAELGAALARSRAKLPAAAEEPAEALPPVVPGDAETLPPPVAAAGAPPAWFDTAAEPTAREPAAPATRRRPPLVAAAALLLAAGAGAGTLAAPSGDPPDAPPRVVGTKGVRAGHLRTIVPADWSVAAAPARMVGGLRLRATATARPGGDARTEVVIGTSAARGPALVPAGIAEAAQRTTVRLGSAAGYRYEGASIGGRDATVFVVPATDGVSTVVCLGASPSLAAACAGAAAALRLEGASAFPLGPSRSVANALGRALGRANDALAEGEAIAGAATAGAQASLAGAVADGLREAAALVPATASPAVLPALAAFRGTLGEAASAYEALAGAASAGDRARWADARRAVARALAGVTAAVEALGDLGYASS